MHQQHASSAGTFARAAQRRGPRAMELVKPRSSLRSGTTRLYAVISGLRRARMASGHGGLCGLQFRVKGPYFLQW